ncbi:MAG TPA: PglZ domain-containing protein, partial [Deltaproteobacteria bacterium]|nr:PglZ domain-containing protein [Deltaproteobacteria bacterium]
FDVEATAAFAQLPTITEVGMASLVAGANTRLGLVETGKSGVGIKAGDSILKDRKTRIKYFTNLMHNENIVVLKLNELMKPSKKRREDIAQTDMILVTSQEIDRLGEEVEDEEEARRFMDEVLGKLRRAIRKLGDLGVEKIVISADHGYLFVDEIEEGLKIDPPGGNTADLRSRVWIGKGGARAPGSLRINSDQIGLAGDLELVFPVGLGCYRKRGPYRGYFHGGISLQEALVPVITITVLKKSELASAVEASVQLKLAKPKITTRFFSIEVRYVVGGLFDFMGVAKQDTKRVKVVVRAGRQNVGKAAMAAYGFEEGRSEAEIVLERDKPNAITMMLTEEFESPVVSVHVLDALTDVELASLKNIPVEISI